jgi:hypothetical protein
MNRRERFARRAHTDVDGERLFASTPLVTTPGNFERTGVPWKRGDERGNHWLLIALLLRSAHDVLDHRATPTGPAISLATARSLADHPRGAPRGRRESRATVMTSAG